MVYARILTHQGGFSSMIIDFNSYRNKKTEKITEEDIFNLILIFKYGEIDFFNINNIMESLGCYARMERFKNIYENLNVITNLNNFPIVDLTDIYEKMLEDRLIIESHENEFMIVASFEKINELKEKYCKDVLESFENLMFFVNNDLKYGIGNWEFLFEDEVLQYPKYPSIVTGEFIGKEKNPETMQKIKKRSIERLKSQYGTIK